MDFHDWFLLLIGLVVGYLIGDLNGFLSGLETGSSLAQQYEHLPQ